MPNEASRICERLDGLQEAVGSYALPTHDVLTA